uniref:Fas apoptotic inhibitory molecule 1 n=1 Tax=Ascaris suum TaxID=6253 RepID=F1LFX4_ASCSU
MVDNQDTVAIWMVPLQDKVHKIEFEHGTTTGKRIIRVDGQEVLRKDWMFKLVGKETFTIGKMTCVISVEALGTFAYEYSLEVNGKAYEKFREEQSKLLQTWNVNISGEDTRICLEKGTMDIWVNGQKMDTAGEFVEDGTETHFEVGSNVCCVKASSSGKKNVGVVHRLFVNGVEMPPAAQ